MRGLALISSFLVSASLAVLGCGSSRKGPGNGEPDSGAVHGGSGSGGSATGGSNATGGTLETGGAVGQGGAGGSMATGGGLAGAGGGTGGVTASGATLGGGGSGGLAATGGVPGTGGAQSGGGTGFDGGAQAGGSAGSASGGARTGGSTGLDGGTGDRGTGGTATGGVNSGTGGGPAGGAGGVGGTAGSGSGGSGRGGSSGHQSCQADTDCAGFKCCGNLCANPQNDILNCGGCGTICSGPDPYCNGGKCGTAPCQGTTCGAGGACCGSQCCGAGQLCCMVTVGPSVLGCYDPVDGTCPTGCASCVCAAPDTPIATPQGERPIAELRVGDWVYSVDHGQIRPVPIKRINRQSVLPSHIMVNLRLASGRTLLVSPLHPTADGRTFQDLARGDLLDGVPIAEASRVAYHQPFTYDILPDSDSGAYFAASVLIGSTLASPTAVPLVSATLPAPASCLPAR
jgi:hypothetical protein